MKLVAYGFVYMLYITNTLRFTLVAEVFIAYIFTAVFLHLIVRNVLRVPNPQEPAPGGMRTIATGNGKGGRLFGGCFPESVSVTESLNTPASLNYVEPFQKLSKGVCERVCV